MTELHSALGWPVVIVNGIGALWALAAHWRPEVATRALWPTIFVGQGLIFVQAFLGAAALSGFDGERPGFHIFYGFLAMTGVLLLYAYRNYEGLSRHRYLLYGLGGLFVAGLLIRTVLLNSPV